MRSGLLMMVLFVTLYANAAEEPIGRLFFTPQQRSQLDLLRQNAGSPSAATEEAQVITLDGLVRRSSGKDTAWINHAARNAHAVAGSAATGEAGHEASAVTVELPSGKRMNLKAGQSYDLDSGRVSEPYENAPVPAQDADTSAKPGK